MTIACGETFGRRTAWNSLSEASFGLAALLRLAHEQDCCVLTLDHHKKRGAQPDVVRNCEELGDPRNHAVQLDHAALNIGRNPNGHSSITSRTGLGPSMGTHHFM